jgi:NhaP-type Na+/H+ or K+/H+ antiporter
MNPNLTMRSEDQLIIGDITMTVFIQTLTSVGLGALLGFFGTYINHRLTIRKESRAIRLQKIEDLTLIALQIRNLSTQIPPNPSELLAKNEDLKPRLELNINLFNQRFKYNGDELLKHLSKILMAIINGLGRRPPDAASLVSPLLPPLHDSVDRLLIEVRKEAEELLHKP